MRPAARTRPLRRERIALDVRVVRTNRRLQVRPRARPATSPVLLTFAEKLRAFRLVSDTLPTRAVRAGVRALVQAADVERSLSARSTPTVPSFCIHDSGRQFALTLPVKRWTSSVVVYCMIEPGANEFASCSGKPVGS